MIHAFWKGFSDPGAWVVIGQGSLILLCVAVAAAIIAVIIGGGAKYLE